MAAGGQQRQPARRNRLRISERAMLASRARARLDLAHRVHTHTPSLSHAHPRPLHNHGVHGVHNRRGGGRSEGKASMGGAPALAGHNTACGGVFPVWYLRYSLGKKKKNVSGERIGEREKKSFSKNFRGGFGSRARGLTTEQFNASAGGESDAGVGPWRLRARERR